MSGLLLHLYNLIVLGGSELGKFDRGDLVPLCVRLSLARIQQLCLVQGAPSR